MSIETFGNGGEVSITNVAATHSSKAPLSLQSIGGNTSITALRVTKLRSIWPK
jgi:sucrose-6-phosphate hydrolase SacC (GH32 family)